jgi:chromosome segregation ATPase
MIQKIKDLMQIKELIGDINNKVESHSNDVNSLKQELTSLNKELNEIKGNQTEFLTNFKDNLNTINECKENLRKEVYDFKLLKAQTQKNILEKFEQELSKELKLYSEKLKNDLNEYNKLKEQTNTTLTNIKNLSGEINKFTEVSKNIKKEDFELNKFANKLLEADKEKLELMKKIDTLERLISKMRRQGR